MLQPIFSRVLTRRGNNFPLTCFMSSDGHYGQKSTKQMAKKVEKIKKYWFMRYLDYLGNYDETLQKTFPRMMKVYKTVSNGTQNFYTDFKNYLAIRKKRYRHGVDSLISQELKIAHQLPKDVVKISPTLLVLAIPFTNYVVFPLIYFFPRKLLTWHYWTEQQKDDFMDLDHKERARHKFKIFQTMKVLGAEETGDVWKNLVEKIEKGERPSSSEILDCKNLFVMAPFGLKKLKRNHLKDLLQMHEMSTFRLNKKGSLMKRGVLIQQMDTAIKREGGVSHLTISNMKWALAFRGINPVHFSQDDMQNCLDEWLRISTNVDENSISLLLHCPILLAYNFDLRKFATS